MNQKDITLTAHEIEEIKDEATFRAIVRLELKRLRGIPDKVTSLAIHRGIHWFLISTIFVSIAILFIRNGFK